MAKTKLAPEQIQFWQDRQRQRREYLQKLNHLAYISHHNDQPCKNKIATDDLEQMKFHLNQLFPNIKGTENIFFAYKQQGDQFFQFSYKMNQLTDSTLRKILYLGRKCDLYVSQNTFFIPGKRTAENAWSSHAMIIDIDYYNIDQYKHLSPEQLLHVMTINGEFDELQPSYAMSSGRGLYLVYLTNLVALQKLHIMHRLRRDVVAALIKKFEKYGSDPSGTDLSRVNRVPGSNNLKVDGVVSRLKIDHIRDENEICDNSIGLVARDLRAWNIYNHMLEFSVRDPLLNQDEEYNYQIGKAKPESKPPVHRNKKCYIIDFKNVKEKDLPRYELLDMADLLLPNRNKKKTGDTANYSRRKLRTIKTRRTLNEARIKDIFTVTILKTKSGKEIHRRNSLWCLSNAYGNIGIVDEEGQFQKMHDFNYIKKQLERLNSLFPVPISDSVLNDYARYGSKKTVKQTNAEIMDLLDIDIKEQQHMTTLICSEVKYQRYLERLLKEKEERAAAKNQKVQERKTAVLECLSRGMSTREISLEMNLSESTIHRVKRLIAKEDNEYMNIEKQSNDITPNPLKDGKNDTPSAGTDPNQLSLLDFIGFSAVSSSNRARNKGFPIQDGNSGPPESNIEIA